MKKAKNYSKEYKYTLFVLTLEVFANVSQALPALQTLFA